MSAFFSACTMLVSAYSQHKTDHKVPHSIQSPLGGLLRPQAGRGCKVDHRNLYLRIAQSKFRHCCRSALRKEIRRSLSHTLPPLLLLVIILSAQLHVLRAHVLPNRPLTIATHSL